jgi:hypothetical protein
LKVSNYKFVAISFFYDEDSEKYLAGMNIFITDDHIVPMSIIGDYDDKDEMISKTLGKITDSFTRIIPIAYLVEGESEEDLANPIEIDLSQLVDDYDWFIPEVDYDDDKLKLHIESNKLIYMDISRGVH